MRKILISLLFIIGLNSIAQDKIYLKNGEKIEARIIKVTEEKIEYKKFNNQDGPLFEISLNKMQLVVYENGESQIFDNNESIEKNNPVNKTKTQFGKNRINLDLFAYGVNGLTSISYEMVNETGSRGVEIPINLHYQFHFKGFRAKGLTTGINLKYYMNKKGKGFFFGPSLGLGLFSWRTNIISNDVIVSYSSDNNMSIYLGPKIGGQFQITKLLGVNLAANGGIITNFNDLDYGASLNFGMNFTF